MPATDASSASPHAVARWCAAQGWPVHPLAPGRKTPAANCRTCREQRHLPTACPCLPAGKPCHGFHAATMDARLIDSWWSTTPAAGVGVACGAADLVVIDIDAHSVEVPARSRLLPGIPIHESVDLEGLASGFDTLALLAALHQQTDPAHDENTLRVRTPSGGLHVWYRNPDPTLRYRCSTGSSSKVALAWQVDIRADGGYIVAPTTRTPAGAYTAEGAARLPAPLPAWLAQELLRTGHRADSRPTVPIQKAPDSPRGTGTTAATSSALRRLVDEVAACAATPEGAAFTEKLNKAAYTAGGLVAAGHADNAVVRQMLTEVANSARPWQSTRNERIINDALAAGYARPFHLKGRS
ncbi:bifunctional DNA primase/polymerase [Streptomyces sp. NBC_00568]|nr:bifunctional DNA primase/polymerase [Streptomyces sp. NBC_00568]